MSEKKCVCGHELESRGYQVLELHGESLLKDYMDVELWVCPRCGRIAFFMREKDRKDRYRAECGGRTDEELSALLSRASGKHIEAMVYGDGAFKDPVGKIWELADPVVSPGYTKGLVGTPNELKLKYLADNDFGDLKGEALKEAIEERIREKTSESLVGNMVSEGTTPRRLTDLIGSLCDLTSGSGDKGTPIVYIQGYFDNYSND